MLELVRRHLLLAGLAALLLTLLVLSAAPPSAGADERFSGAQQVKWKTGA